MRKLAANFGKAVGFETVDLTDNAVHSLTLQDKYNYAQIRIKTTSAAANTPVAWYRVDGGTPSADNGIPLLGWEMLDITDYANLANFKIIAVASTEKLYVQYYNIQY
jgi:hypothetical protein